MHTGGERKRGAIQKKLREAKKRGSHHTTHIHTQMHLMCISLSFSSFGAHTTSFVFPFSFAFFYILSRYLHRVCLRLFLLTLPPLSKGVGTYVQKCLYSSFPLHRPPPTMFLSISFSSLRCPLFLSTSLL